MNRIAVFGGSFNPIHVGHIRIARCAVSEGMADEVWLMPSPQNPLKPADGLLDERLRLKMVREALEDEPSIKACDFEFSLPRPTYTYLTLRAMSREFSDKVFSLMIGSDNWAIFHRWRNYEEILNNHEIIIYNRPGTELSSEDLPPNVSILKGELTDVSSTSIRRKVLAGEDISADVPSSIAGMVRKYYSEMNNV